MDEYNLAKKFLGSEALYRFALEKIEAGEDEAVLAQALKDVLRFSLVLKVDPKEPLEHVEKLLKRTEKDSELFGRLKLAQARFWMRGGQVGKAMRQMKRGALERWKENAFWDINEGLQEIGREDLCAIDEYDRNTSDDYSPELRSFYGIGSDLYHFFDRVRTMRVKHPDWTAAEKVLPHLKASKWRPHALPCAKALCLAADERYRDALEILLPLEERIADAPKDGGYDESKDFPLIKAMVLLMEGRDYNAMREAFGRYIEINRDDPVKVADRASDLVYTVSKSESDLGKMLELTGFILKSELVSDESLRKQLPEDLLAELHDKHQMGLVFRGHVREAAEWAKKGMDLYFPQTFAGTNCAINWAAYLSGQAKHNEAKQIYYKILKDTTYDVLIYSAHYHLAFIERLYGNDQNALNHLRAIEDKVSPQTTGPASNYLKRALELKKKILAGVN